ncbi:C-type lectin domain family 1 member A-like isoform X2 [Trachinotus anak]|uniref:C-type lectin domain family 1 member A-like isoform X2 n=1 Tax=Trachinotus anak TaxID=443729 RepID=UPI0039F230FB
MSQDIYAKPDLTKKVRFQTGEKEDRDADVYDKTDNVVIYDNCWIEGSTLPKLQDTTEDQQQTVSVHAPSGRRDLVRPAAAFLGLLCLLLLAALIAVVVLLIQDKSLNTNLTRERDRLQTSYSEMKTLVVNLTRERDRLQTSNSEMKTLVNNLTQETNQLQTEVSELREQLETASCPDKWIRFGNSCYSYYTVKKTMSESQQFCETHGAQLPIVSSEEEQL